MKKLSLSALLLCLCIGVLSSEVTAQTIVLPPFVYTGRIVNYNNASLADITESAEIGARKDGKLIARSKIVNVPGTPHNFSLSVPMASTPLAGAAVTGDQLTFEVYFGDKTYTATNSFVAVGNPGRVAYGNFMAASDSNADGVADEYVNVIKWYMEVYGIAGDYDPHADYDGDGVSNYHEYIAGTDPFSVEDHLRILSLASVPGNTNVLAATFMASKHRVYSVNNAATALTNRFTHAPFRINKTKEAPDYDYLQTDSNGNDIRTIYLLKSGDAQFYRLRVE